MQKLIVLPTDPTDNTWHAVSL